MNSYAVYSSETLDSGQDLSEAGGGWTGLMPEQGGSTVEISLDPELLNTLYRRSRRRLRDIQASCQALLKLDRTRSSLRVTGSEEAIRAVRRHLENLCGPCKPLPAAVWAELMRTRTLSHSSRATIARLQNQSGCRIHIERSRQEVRLFGPKEGIAMADKLLDDFAESCGEEAVSAGSPTASLDSTTLQALAHAFSVTLRVEDHQVVVLGIKESVAEACKELRTFISNPDSYDTALLPKAPDSECEELAAKEQPKELTRAAGAPGGGGVAGAARMGVVTKTKPPSEQFTSKGSSQAHQAEHSAAKSSQGGGRCCPTCGSGRFCSGCGAAIWQVNVLNFMPQGMMAAGIPMQQPGYDVQAQQCMAAGAMGGMALQQPDQREGFEPDGQMQQQQQAWGPVQQPQMMYCMDPKAAGKMSATTGMVPMQFQAMQQGSSGNASASRNHHQQQQQQQQQQQMGMMQAYMVPVGSVPAWCGL